LEIIGYRPPNYLKRKSNTFNELLLSERKYDFLVGINEDDFVINDINLKNLVSDFFRIIDKDKIIIYNKNSVADYKWIKKYVNLMDKYLEKIIPNVSDVWRTYELYLKIRENKKYLFTLIYDETRFWIAQQVADNKNTIDMRPVFKEVKEIAGKGKKTSILISDGTHNFHEAYP
jgi:hypothetical protein